MKALSKNTKTILGVAAVAALGLYLYQRSTGKSLYSNAAGSNWRHCSRTNDDGSTTNYTAGGSSRPCPHGGTLVN